jgi:hypothetical protein
MQNHQQVMAHLARLQIMTSNNHLRFANDLKGDVRLQPPAREAPTQGNFPQGGKQPRPCHPIITGQYHSLPRLCCCNRPCCLPCPHLTKGLPAASGVAFPRHRGALDAMTAAEVAQHSTTSRSRLATTAQLSSSSLALWSHMVSAASQPAECATARLVRCSTT